MNRLGVATACGLGLAVLAVALYAWHSMADTELDTNGVIALTLGIVATMVLGALLVGLMIYSSRRGYDDRIGQGPTKKDPPSQDPPP